jgi:hypothetical protein
MPLLLNLRELGLVPAPFESSYIKLLLTARFHLVVALTTIYWPALSRLKGHFAVFTTLNTYCGIHLAVRPVTAKAIVPGSLCFTASRATLGLVSISPTSIELLFLSGECECSTTVRTLQGFVCKSHWTTSFLIILGSSFGHPTFANELGRAYIETW